MSHVSVHATQPGKPFITDLECARKAMTKLGLTVLEQSSYRWYGRSVGDYPIPAGWNTMDMGLNAVLVGRVAKPKGTTVPYDLAIVPDKNNPGAYTVMYDFYARGMGLDDYVGSPIRDGSQIKTLAPKFVQQYHMAVEEKTAAEHGDVLTWEEQTDGSFVSYTEVNQARLQG